jgi:hypothetical protein
MDTIMDTIMDIIMDTIITSDSLDHQTLPASG